jgi:autotransporter-associated beta strand protein
LFANGLVPEVDFGGTAGTILGFLAGTSEQIGVMAPAGTPSTVDVTVTTGGGTSATSPADQFTYDAVPIVSGLDVFEGPSSGGTTVTIFGTGLSNAEAVDFGIDGFPATIVSDADNQLVVVSPQISPQFYPAATQDVIVQTPGGTSATSSADEFTYVAAPTVVDVDSDSGFTTGGDSITIYGTNLDTATAVNFGANAATIVSESADSIQVLTPAGTFGTVNVTVVNPGGTSATSSADLYSYQAPTPVVEGLSQSVGPTLGGTTVTITGEYFDDASEVDFGPYASTIVSDSSSQIVVSSPAGIDGTVDLTVTTPGGTSLDSTFDQFTGVPAPAVTGIGSAAEFGSVAGGTTVYIYGTDLENASAVDFGATAGTIVSDSATYLVATSPAGAAGPVAVTVATPYGTSATSLADQFTYIGSPQTMAHGYTIDQGTALTVSGPGVLAGDVDPQGIALTAELLGNPTYGSLAFGSDGSFIYTPENGYFGTDTFTYQADNGYTVSGPTTVSITVVENNPLATQVTNTADNGAGSLRQALQAAAADTSGEPYSIQFVMPLGSQTINLLSPLPAVSDPLWVSLDATQNVAINASPTSAWDNYNALTKSGDGTLTLTEAASFNGNIAVEGGQLQLNEPSTPTIALGVGATVTGDGTIELAGSVSDLTSAVNIANGSTATAGILVSGTNQVVGAITGNGNLAVAAGSDLTANSIVQNTLVIGAGSTLTIAPSGPGIQTDATAPSSTVETDADPAVVSDGSSDPITAIQAAIASGSISAVKGQQLENRIAMIKRLVATGTGLDLSLLESDVLAALPAPVTSTTTTAASEPPPLQVATIVPPVVDHALAADYRSVAGSLAPLALTPNNAATIMNNGTASSGARESLMTQLFQELAHDPSGAIAGYSISSPTEFSWKDTTVAGPAQMSQDASRTIFEALALDFADVQSNGSRHASGSGGRIDSDSMTRDWSDEFLYAVSAFGDSSTEAD